MRPTKTQPTDQVLYLNKVEMFAPIQALVSVALLQISLVAIPGWHINVSPHHPTD